MNLKKNTIILILFIFLASNEVKASDECFEAPSRAVFKFNMAFDNAILEPVAKGYISFQNRLEMELVILHLTLQLFYQYQITFFKVI